MGPESGNSGRLSWWAHAAAWTLGGFFVAAVLANVCIMAGAILALVIESEASRSVGMVVNGAALVVMIALYTGSLWGLTTLIGSRREISPLAWVGLALYPTVWLVVVVVAPQGTVALTPTVVSAAGALLTWIAVRRIRRPSDDLLQESPG